MAVIIIQNVIMPFVWYKPTGDICPKCGELIVDKNGNKICLNCDE